MKLKLRNGNIGLLTQDDLAQKERGKDLITQGSGRRPQESQGREQRWRNKPQNDTLNTKVTTPCSSIFLFSWLKREIDKQYKATDNFKEHDAG